MKRNRKNAGFSMGELLVVVAILVILMGLGFVALIQYQRTLKQLELDGIAKEIFVAAQNHLTMADSQGLLEGKTDGTADAEKDVYYFVGGKGGTSPDNGSTALSLMLPFASVDETVRAGGSYVIRYQKTGARVLDVFYAQPDNSRFGHTFTDGEYTTLLDLRGDDHKSNRRSCGTDKHVIGWYNGDGLTEGKPLAKPTLQIINAERLVVKVTNPNTSGLLAEQNEFDDLIIQLQITGMSSGAECVIPLADGTGKPKPNYEYVLDDITAENGHFSQRVVSKDVLKPFIPGENISVQVKAWHKNSEAAIVYSASKQTNSLFASMDEVENPTTKLLDHRTAYIANIRHLENLGTNVSGYSGRFGTDGVLTVEAKAEQINDLSWPDFLEKIAAQKKMEQKDVRVTGTSKAGVYLPANPNYPLDYDGQGYRISDIAVEHDGAAGIFGKLNNSNIKRVLVCNDNTKDDSALEITGTGSTGALVGVMNGGSIDSCAAAVYVRSSNGSAGGLIGQTTGTVSVTKSYSGGHTIDGVYQNSDSGQGRYNVNAKDNAGGLIGTASGTEVTNSYSTCSAKGDASGGLIGSASGGNVTTCYATGLVGGNRTKGAFIGSGTLGTLTGNAYYSIINGEVPAIGSDPENTEVAAFDGDLDSYNKFLTMLNPAQPYDDALRTYYGGQYALKTISQLAAAGTDAPAWVSAHYGDWPAPETLVVNVK